MRDRLLWPASAAGLLAVLLASPAAAQGVNIDHSAVECIVAGQYPVLDACFTPSSSLARARVFFRPPGASTWYFVEGKDSQTGPAGARCLKATLPRPKKDLITKHVEYYVEAMGRSLDTVQSPTHSPLVVASASECDKKPMAAFVSSAAVQVFPTLPAGFAAASGIITPAAVAIVGGGVAAATSVAVVAANGGSDEPAATTVPPTQPPVTAPPVTQPPTAPTTTSTTVPVGFVAQLDVYKGGALEPGNSINGGDPTDLRFVMCESKGPFRLRFQVAVNGNVVTVGCDSTIRFGAGGVTVLSSGGVSSLARQVRALAAVYTVQMFVQSDGPGNNPQASRTLTVDVTGTPPSTTTTTTTTTTMPPCAGDAIGPDVTSVGATPATVPPYPLTLTATADDSGPRGNNGVTAVVYKFVTNSSNPDIFVPEFVLGSSTSGPGFTVTIDQATATSLFNGAAGTSMCSATGEIHAFAQDGCRNVGPSSTPITVNFAQIDPACFRFLGRAPAAPDASETWLSELGVRGGEGQIVLNGRLALRAQAGRHPLRAALAPGPNRVEATLVRAGGESGLWRFELGPDADPASLRVIAGDVAEVAAEAVVFRLRGKPGERVVFEFRSR